MSGSSPGEKALESIAGEKSISKPSVFKKLCAVKSSAPTKKMTFMPDDSVSPSLPSANDSVVDVSTESSFVSDSKSENPAVPEIGRLKHRDGVDNGVIPKIEKPRIENGEVTDSSLEMGSVVPGESPTFATDQHSLGTSGRVRQEELASPTSHIKRAVGTKEAARLDRLDHAGKSGDYSEVRTEIECTRSPGPTMSSRSVTHLDTDKGTPSESSGISLLPTRKFDENMRSPATHGMTNNASSGGTRAIAAKEMKQSQLSPSVVGRKKGANNGCDCQACVTIVPCQCCFRCRKRKQCVFFLCRRENFSKSELAACRRSALRLRSQSDKLLIQFEKEYGENGRLSHIYSRSSWGTAIEEDLKEANALDSTSTKDGLGTTEVSRRLHRNPKLGLLSQSHSSSACTCEACEQPWRCGSCYRCRSNVSCVLGLCHKFLPSDDEWNRIYRSVARVRQVLQRSGIWQKGLHQARFDKEYGENGRLRSLVPMLRSQGKVKKSWEEEAGGAKPGHGHVRQKRSHDEAFAHSEDVRRGAESSGKLCITCSQPIEDSFHYCDRLSLVEGKTRVYGQWLADCHDQWFWGTMVKRRITKRGVPMFTIKYDDGDSHEVTANRFYTAGEHKVAKLGWSTEETRSKTNGGDAMLKLDPKAEAKGDGRKANEQVHQGVSVSELDGSKFYHKWIGKYGLAKEVYGRVHVETDIRSKPKVSVAICPASVRNLHRFGVEAGEMTQTIKGIDEEDIWAGCESYLREAGEVITNTRARFQRQYFVPKMNEMSESAVPCVSFVVKGYEVRMEVVKDVGVRAYIKPLFDDLPSHLILNAGELVDLGVYGPLRLSDVKDHHLASLKSFMFSRKCDRWIKGTTADGLVIDMTDDETGELHRTARHYVLPFVEAADTTPSLWLQVDPEGALHYFLGHPHRYQGPLKLIANGNPIKLSSSRNERFENAHLHRHVPDGEAKVWRNNCLQALREYSHDERLSARSFLTKILRRWQGEVPRDRGPVSLALLCSLILKREAEHSASPSSEEELTLWRELCVSLWDLFNFKKNRHLILGHYSRQFKKLFPDAQPGDFSKPDVIRGMI